MIVDTAAPIIPYAGIRKKFIPKLDAAAVIVKKEAYFVFFVICIPAIKIATIPKSIYDSVISGTTLCAGMYSCVVRMISASLEKTEIASPIKRAIKE